MSIGSAPEIGAQFGKWGDYPSFDAAMEWHRRWAMKVGPDLLGGYATLCYPTREPKSNTEG